MNYQNFAHKKYPQLSENKKPDFQYEFPEVYLLKKFEKMTGYPLPPEKYENYSQVTCSVPDEVFDEIYQSLVFMTAKKEGSTRGFRVNPPKTDHPTLYTEETNPLPVYYPDTETLNKVTTASRNLSQACSYIFESSAFSATHDYDGLASIKITKHYFIDDLSYFAFSRSATCFFADAQTITTSRLRNFQNPKQDSNVELTELPLKPLAQLYLLLRCITAHKLLINKLFTQYSTVSVDIFRLLQTCYLFTDLPLPKSINLLELIEDLNALKYQLILLRRSMPKIISNLKNKTISFELPNLKASVVLSGEYGLISSCGVFARVEEFYEIKQYKDAASKRLSTYKEHLEEQHPELTVTLPALVSVSNSDSFSSKNLGTLSLGKGLSILPSRRLDPPNGIIYKDQKATPNLPSKIGFIVLKDTDMIQIPFLLGANESLMPVMLVPNSNKVADYLRSICDVPTVDPLKSYGVLTSLVKNHKSNDIKMLLGNLYITLGKVTKHVPYLFSTNESTVKLVDINTYIKNKVTTEEISSTDLFWEVQLLNSDLPIDVITSSSSIRNSINLNLTLQNNLIPKE